MRTTIVVATRDRHQQLLRTLPRLVATGAQVVVVDNASPDGAPDAGAHPRVDVVSLRSNLGAAGRTVGVRRARTPYVAFADDDSWWAAGSLPHAEALFDAHPRLGLLAAAVVVEPGGVPDAATEALAASPLEELPGVGPSVLGFLACAAVVRREAYLEVGGFHPRFGVGGEEQLLAIDLVDAGWDVAHAPGLLAHHAPEGGPRPGREQTLVRNYLWTTWLRRTARVAAGASLAALRGAATDPATRRGAAEALGGLPWVLRERRAARPKVQSQLAELDRGSDTGPRQRRMDRPVTGSTGR